MSNKTITTGTTTEEALKRYAEHIAKAESTMSEESLKHACEGVAKASK
jgi:hypothetical protein